MDPSIGTNEVSGVCYFLFLCVVLAEGVGCVVFLIVDALVPFMRKGSLKKQQPKPMVVNLVREQSSAGLIRLHVPPGLQPSKAH